MTLEQAIAYIQDDELVEVTPKVVRIRKRFLDPHERKRMARKAEAAEFRPGTGRGAIRAADGGGAAPASAEAADSSAKTKRAAMPGHGAHCSAQAG